MSKNMLYTAIFTDKVWLTSKERQQWDEEGKTIPYYLVSRMKPELFIDKMFGVEEYYFIPRTEGVWYVPNSLEYLFKHCFYELNKMASELHNDLFTNLNFLFQGLLKIKNTQGWGNNQLVEEEIQSFNNFMKSTTNVNLKTNLQFTDSPLTKRNFQFYVHQGKNKVLTEITEDDYRVFSNAFEVNMLFHEANSTEKEKFEGYVNALCEFIEGIENKQSFTKEEVDYMNGETDYGMHQEVIFATKRIGRAIRYLINTASWRENQWFGFDDFDFKLKARISISEEYCKGYQVKRKEFEEKLNQKPSGTSYVY